MPRITGFASVTANLPATVQNTGLEFTLNTTNIQGKALKWVSSINLTIPRNKLVSYPNIEGSSYSETYVVGEPLSIIRQFHSTGVNTQTGFYEVEDVDGDGLFTVDDRKTIINLGREFYGGVNNTFSYKGFELSFLFEFVKQKGMNRFLIFDQYPGRNSLGMGNQPGSVLDRWQKEGDVTETQKFTQSVGASAMHGRTILSDRAYADASFVRMKTISIGYNLSTEWMERMRLRNAKIFAQGQNLFTLTKHIGLDPQAPGRKELPALTMLTAGVQLAF